MSTREDHVAEIAGLSGPPEEKKKRVASRERATVSISIDKIEKELERTFGFVGVFVFARDQVCGTAILEGAEQLAKSLRVLAEQNKSVRRVLERLISGGAWSGVALAGANIAIPILQHHGLIPSSKPVEPTPLHPEPAEEPLSAPQPESGADANSGTDERVPAELHPLGPVPIG